MTNSGLTTFSKKTSFFQVLIAGGIVGLAMFAFSHIFEAPISCHSDFSVNNVPVANEFATPVSVDTVSLDWDISPDAITQSWPPQMPLGDGLLPGLDTFNRHLTVVGLSGVIPPPGFSFILPAAFNSSQITSINYQDLKTNSEIVLVSSTDGGPL